MTDPIPVLSYVRDAAGQTYLPKGTVGPSGPLGATGPTGPMGVVGATGPSALPHGGQDGDLLTSNGAGGYDWEDHNKWQSFEVLPLLELEWSGEPTDKLYYNSFACVMTLSLYKGGAHPENTWTRVIAPGLIPAHICPPVDLYDAKRGHALSIVGSLFTIAFKTTGELLVSMMGDSQDWDQVTMVPFSFFYPRGKL